MSRGPLAETPPPGKDAGDPLFLHARRELFFTLMAWLAFGLWVVGYSWIMGNRPAANPETISTVLGMPSWVFWGVGLPWVLANVLTFWYCFRFMVDDDLEKVANEGPENPKTIRTESTRGNP